MFGNAKVSDANCILTHWNPPRTSSTYFNHKQGVGQSIEMLLLTFCSPYLQNNTYLSASINKPWQHLDLK